MRMNYCGCYRPWMVCGSPLSALTCLTTAVTRLHLPCPTPTTTTPTSRLHHIIARPLYKPGRNSASKRVRHLRTWSECQVVSAPDDTVTTSAFSPDILSEMSYEPPPRRSHLLMNYFDLSQSAVLRITHADRRLKNCDTYTLEANISTLKKYGLNPDEVRNNLALLYRKPLKLEHDIAIIKELGLINLQGHEYLSLLNLLRSVVLTLQNSKMLPCFYDPLESVLGPLGLPSHLFPNQLRPSQIRTLTLQEVHVLLSSAFLTWQFDCSKERLEKMKAMYNLNRKSITLQHGIIQDMDSYWNIDAEKVMRNPYIISCSPSNISHIANRVRAIAGVDVRELVFLTPRILAIPYQQLLQIDDILTRLDVTQAAVRAIPWVCTLKPETIEERIRLLEQIPELGALKSHPRVLRLIVYYKKVRSRLTHLRLVKKSNAVPSLNMLAGHTLMFEKYVKVGNNRRESRDIITFIAEYFGVTRVTVRDVLHARCWGPHTSLLNVRTNLAHLVKNGFSRDDLYSALDVVLYPPDVLRDQLSQLPDRPEVHPNFDMMPGKTLLRLLLYYMDKKVS